MADTTNILWGCINSDSSIYSGDGFQVDLDGEGFYLIEYDTPFSAIPAVVLTQNYVDWNNFGYRDGDTRDNCVLVASDEEKFKVKTGDSTGRAASRNFTFISIGPVSSDSA